MRRAEPLAGLGGLALFASLFLNWYSATPVVPDLSNKPGFQPVLLAYVRSDAPENAWTSFAVIDIALALFAALALAVPLVSLLARGPGKPIGTAVLASAFGWIAIVLVAYRLVFLPFDDLDGVRIATDVGGFVALAAASLAWVGSWLSMRDESTPGATLPVLERLPAR